MMGSTTSSTSAAITAPPPNTEPPEPTPSRPGPRSLAWPLGHKPSWDRPSCAVSRPEPIKLTVPGGPRGVPAGSDLPQRHRSAAALLRGRWADPPRGLGDQEAHRLAREHDPGVLYRQPGC